MTTDTAPRTEIEGKHVCRQCSAGISVVYTGVAVATRCCKCGIKLLGDRMVSTTKPRTEIEQDARKILIEEAKEYARSMDFGSEDIEHFAGLGFLDGAERYVAKLAERDERIAELNRYIESRELGSSSPETALLAAYRERDAWKQLAIDAEEMSWEYDYDDESLARSNAWLNRLKALRGGNI